MVCVFTSSRLTAYPTSPPRDQGRKRVADPPVVAQANTNDLEHAYKRETNGTSMLG